MKIIPAVDIMDGRCVQLVGGKPGTEEFFGDPVEVAIGWIQTGASTLHVVDLDAALGRGTNLDKIVDICRGVHVPVQVGGGIRDYKTAKHFLELGIDRIILGTMAVKDSQSDYRDIRRLCAEFGAERLVVAVDSREGKITVDGWQKTTGIDAADFMKTVQSLVWGFLYTDVDVEGRLSGVNLDGIRKVTAASDKPVIISGGISSSADIQSIKYCGAWGVVLGKALYSGQIDFRKALDSV